MLCIKIALSSEPHPSSRELLFCPVRPIHHYRLLCKKPQTCPPPLTKSSQKAINILILPSAATTKPPEGPTLCFFRLGVDFSCCSCYSCRARGFLGFICHCPRGQLWFSRGHRVGRCGQEGPPLSSSIKYYSPGLRAPLAAAPAPSNAAASHIRSD